MASARATPREGLVPVSFVGFLWGLGFCWVSPGGQNPVKIFVLKVVHRSSLLDPGFCWVSTGSKTLSKS